ncbi:MAG: AAA family ATPase, partial [Deltaproteobacteria bacterium]|nr:AAA family ATPase [Deltaproteobacteria bacterium]
NSDENVFLTGFAGTGKTFLIQEFLKSKNQKKHYPVLGSTGVSALTVKGRTFHSFFGLGIMQGNPEDVIKKAASNRNVRYRIKHAQCLIIDEISMLSSHALDIADQVTQRVLEDYQPWGGLRVIVVGDFAQLPPISQNYQRPWAFLSESWSRSGFVPLVLQEQTRSEHAYYNEIINKVRVGQIDEEVETFFMERTSIPYDFSGTRLFSKRMQAWQYNMERLMRIPAEMIEIKTSYQGEPHYIQALQKNAPIPEVLHLKKGAKVMVRVNDPLLRYVNGSIGRVAGIVDDKVAVDIRGRIYEFEKISFAWMDGSGNIGATATNFPLQLAWATTIHKAQGLTLDELCIDMKQLWEPGHAYVALSRVRDPNGLYIQNWTKESIKIDPIVEKFYAMNCPSNFIDSLSMIQEDYDM